MTKETTHPLYESSKREVNFEKYGHLSDQCICCGLPMKDGEKLLVHMNTDWVAVRNDISEDMVVEMTGADSQGAFPIGNSCARKMPKEFIIDLSKNKTK